MRRQDDVLQGEELVLGCRRLIDHDVEPGSTDPVGGQRIIERVLVDHGARQVLIRIGIGFISPSSRAPIERGGTLENAQAMAAHESPRTTKLYGRPGDQITFDEVEKKQI
jgi:hypothetical protein